MKRNINFALFSLIIGLLVFGCANDKDHTEGAAEGSIRPTVTTDSVTNIQSVGAKVLCEVVSDGGDMIISRGVCYATHYNVTMKDNIISAGTGTGKYSVNIGGLSRDVKYYYRAYALNNNGYAFGVQKSFIAQVNIGEHFQGGVVFNVDANHAHGFIAAETDLTASNWGCTGTDLLGATGVILGTGDENTDYIMSGCSTSGIAARLCGDLNINGYDDWFLPSRNELDSLFDHRSVVGGFTEDTYWSSTEYDDNNAFSQNFKTGSFGPINKNTLAKVRAIRIF